MITIKSTNSPNSIDGSPFDDFGFNYLWRLRGLGQYMPAFRGMCTVSYTHLTLPTNREV